MLRTSPAQANYHRGVAHLHTYQYDAAIVEFRNAVALDPSFKEAYHGLGLAYFQLGNLEEAKKNAEAALRIDSQYQPALAILNAIAASGAPSVTPPPPADTSQPASPPSAQPPSAPGSPSPAPSSSPSPPAPETGTSSPAPSSSPSQPSPSPGSSSPAPASATPQSSKGRTASSGVSKLWRSTTVVLALVVVGCIVAFAMRMTTKDERIDGLQRQLAKQEKEIGSLVTKNGELQAEIKRLQITNVRSPLRNRGRQNPPTKVEPPNSQANVPDTENLAPVNRGPASATEGFLDPNRKSQEPPTTNGTEGASQGNEDQLSDNQRTRRKVHPPDQTPKSEDKTAELLSQNEMLRADKEELQSQNRQLTAENKALRAQLQKLMESDPPPDIVNTVNPDEEEQQRPTLAPPAPLQVISSGHRPKIRLAALSKNNQAAIAFNKEEYNRAIDLFQDAIKSEPKSAIIHYNLGCTYLAMRDKVKAVECFRQAVSLDANFKEAHYNLAIAWSRRGYRQEAMAAAQKSLKIDQNYKPAKDLLGIIE